MVIIWYCNTIIIMVMIYNTIESHTVLLMMAVVIDFEPLDGDNMVTMFLVFSCFFS